MTSGVDMCEYGLRGCEWAGGVLVEVGGKCWFFEGGGGEVVCSVCVRVVGSGKRAREKLSCCWGVVGCGCLMWCRVYAWTHALGGS